MRAVSTLVLLITCSLGCAGGQGLADSTYPGEPLGYLEGELRSGGRTPSFALLWVTRAERLSSLLSAPAMPALCEVISSQWAVPQSVAYQARFPIEFSAPLTTVPSAAQIDLGALGGSGRLAFGVVLAFQDQNQAGQFDLGPRADPLIATSLSAHRSQVIVFLDGSLPASSALPAGIPPGFSVLSSEKGQSAQVLPPSTRISLESSAAPCP